MDQAGSRRTWTGSFAEAPSSSCSRRVAGALLAAFAAALLACSSEPPECYQDADCPEDTVCIDELCESLYPTCETSHDCPEGRICFDNVCHYPADVGGCQDDDDCDPGETCNELTGRCVAEPHPCSHSADCAEGHRCENGWCVSEASETGCVSDDECARPLICGGSAGCVPGCEITGCGEGGYCDAALGRCKDQPPGCVVDTDCDPPFTICTPPDCAQGCLSTGCGDDLVCDSETGRCVEAQAGGCTIDADCDPPWTICEPPECVGGCISWGCPDGHGCDSETGRCVDDDAPPECVVDADCDPPWTICEPPECTAGCISWGCPEGFTCDSTSGRCIEEEPPPECALDDDCDPPHQICESEACVAGCLTTGCPTGSVCDESTGRCGAGEPGDLALGAFCEDPDEHGAPDHEACAVDHCLETPGGFVCANPCSAAVQCPAGFTCDATVPDGAMACLSAPGLGDSLPGAPCAVGSTCKSGWCLDTYCTDVCQHDRDCAGLPGHACMFFFGNFGLGEEMVTACGNPSYHGWGQTGDLCYGDLDCLRGNCVASGRCADPCHTSHDCPGGYVCNSVSYFQSWRRACVFAGQATGTAGVGSACDPATHQPCRSLWCLERGDVPGEGVCIDTCGTQADCPGGYRCEIVPLDATGDGLPNVRFPLCLPR